MDKYIDNNNPCYKCSDRKLYCHSNCLRYISWKVNNKKNKLTSDNDRYVYNKAVQRHKRQR